MTTAPEAEQHEPSDRPLTEIVAEEIRVLMARRATVRQSDLAELLGVSQSAISSRLHGRITGKGGRVRVVPIHPVLAQALGARPEGYVFRGRIDGHLSPHWVGKKLGLLLGPGWSGHTLRHRFSTEAYAVQHDLFAVQALLGHSKPETTLRYTALPDDALRAAVGGIAA